MRTLWIGLRTEDVRCGHTYGLETIGRMRDRRTLLSYGATALQAIFAGGRPIGFGLIAAHYTQDVNIPIDTTLLQSSVEEVKRALGMIGIGGKFTVNVEETDVATLPAKWVSS